MEDGIGEPGARRERSESYPVGRRKADPVAKLQLPLPLTTSLKPQASTYLHTPTRLKDGTI